MPNKNKKKNQNKESNDPVALKVILLALLTQFLLRTSEIRLS
jgi:hypothetical protein